MMGFGSFSSKVIERQWNKTYLSMEINISHFMLVLIIKSIEKL